MLVFMLGASHIGNVIENFLLDPWGTSVVPPDSLHGPPRRWSLVEVEVPQWPLKKWSLNRGVHGCTWAHWILLCRGFFRNGSPHHWTFTIQIRVGGTWLEETIMPLETHQGDPESNIQSSIQWDVQWAHVQPWTPLFSDHFFRGHWGTSTSARDHLLGGPWKESGGTTDTPHKSNQEFSVTFLV
jgi:hypothetical protein